ncbi:MAG: FGGY-family carbohydrate kinase [Synergistaceae bacterium]|nr:FGGY-family carbohydrate kinase [Synergistaceae bacterium]
MSGKYYVGIDIGTYESKGALVDENANLITSYTCQHLMESPRPGWAEHDAESTWWADFCEISNMLIDKSKIDPHDIAAVGCSTIAPCCLPVDASLKPLRKAILYGIDVRATEEIDFLEKKYGKRELFERYGTPLTTQSAGAKVLWIKNKEPDVFAKADKFITGSTYLVAKLTGNFVIDHYTAATWVPLYNVAACDWEADTSLICERKKLAECRWTNEIVGTVRDAASRETGLAVGTKVMSGTADASAEAISVGVTEPGDMMLMYGSSIFIIHVVKKFTRDERLWAGPYLFPGTYSVAAGMSCAGTLTRWFRDNFSPDIVSMAEKDGQNVYALLAETARDISPGSDGLTVLPYFSGERTPINDPLAKGLIFGLNLHHTREHIYNAILEGVGYGIDQHFEIFDKIGLGTCKVMAVGGGVKNAKWLQCVTDISGKTQHVAEINMGAAYGDALLAALSDGRYNDQRELARIIKIKSSVHPDDSRHGIYGPYKERYRALYLATRDIMHSY